MTIAVVPTREHAHGFTSMIKTMLRYLKDDSDLVPFLPTILTLKNWSNDKKGILITTISEMASPDKDIVKRAGFIAFDNTEQIKGKDSEIILNL